MKKYFAKYLPVGSEIEEKDIKHGDRVYSPDKLYGQSADQKGGIIIFDERIIYDTSFTDGKPKWFRVNLLLCSRDIQEGDEFWMYTQHGPYIAENYIVNFLNYKIIGLISTDAFWIKEGDEFDEEEIKREIITKWYAGEDDYTEYVHHYPKGDEKFINTEDKFISEDPIKIKCPCCGDFK